MDIAGLRFLVVEDHQFQRWMVANHLEGLGARYVVAAGDGRQALTLLETNEPGIDIVITDLDMPEMDGMEFLRHVGRRQFPCALIIATSMEAGVVASVETMSRAYGVDLVGTIEKPVTARKLNALLAARDGRPRPAPAPAPLSFSAAQVAEGLHRGQIEVFYQPKVDLHTAEMKGAEALARWRHPQHGLVRPESFLASIEEQGLEWELTERVVTAAARACAAWRAGGLDATVAVNVSTRLLADPSLAARITDLVASNGLEPRHLVVEVTESAAMGSVGPTLENLSRLRVRGFGLSIDDFGTGHSSLERLAAVPFTELKIDRTFVVNAEERPASRAMLETCVMSASKLGMAAVAEGVERRTEWDLVRGLGCQLAQGYYVARPLETTEVADWAQARWKATA